MEAFALEGLAPAEGGRECPKTCVWPNAAACICVFAGTELLIACFSRCDARTALKVDAENCWELLLMIG